VYRVHGAPRDLHEDLRADWLALDPARTAPERLRDRDTPIAVSHRSAASVHGIGDLPADTHHFTSTARKQSSRARVTVPRTPLESASLEIVEGLPVTTVERTIADLVRTEADVSHVADAAGDADARGSLRHDILARELESVASKVRAASGLDAVEHLLAYRGLDTSSLANAVLANSGFQRRLDAVRAELETSAGAAFANMVVMPPGLADASRRIAEAMQPMIAAQSSISGIDAILERNRSAFTEALKASGAIEAMMSPALTEALKASGAIEAMMRPVLAAMAANALDPAYAALRSAARTAMPTIEATRSPNDA
jgi:hypothetical protein